MNASAWDRFAHAPFVLRAYLTFAVLVSVFWMFRSGTGWFPETVAFTGWSPGMPYMATIFFAIHATLTPGRESVYAVVWMLGLGMVLGAEDAIRHALWPSPDFNNPYLIYHPYRPAFTVGLPACWLVLLISPRMRKWIHDAPRNTTNSSTESIRFVDSARPSP